MAEEETYPEADRAEGAPHPRETGSLFGQDDAQSRFLDAWHGGRLHHAWMLRGPQGVGKATLAYRMARTLIAQPLDVGGLFGSPDLPETLDAPAGCPVHPRILAQSEPRLCVLRREWMIDKKRMQTGILVDNVRNMRRFLSLSAADGGWRVVIVDAVDDMNRNAANALLKFLEEPPEHTLFALVCHASAGVLPTIRSRCRTLDLMPLNAGDMARALEQCDVAIPDDQQSALAELSSGSVGQALRLVAEDGLATYGGLVRILGSGRVDRAAMMALAERCTGRGADGFYRASIELVRLMTARLARAAAKGQRGPEAAPGEHRLMAHLANVPEQASLWAEALARISATTRHAMAVNLDPAQCVIDTLLELDDVAGRARAVAP